MGHESITNAMRLHILPGSVLCVYYAISFASSHQLVHKFCTFYSSSIPVQCTVRVCFVKEQCLNELLLCVGWCGHFKSCSPAPFTSPPCPACLPSLSTCTVSTRTMSPLPSCPILSLIPLVDTDSSFVTCFSTSGRSSTGQTSWGRCLPRGTTGMRTPRYR